MPHLTLAFARMFKHHRNGREDVPYSEYRQEMIDAGVPLDGRDCTMKKLVSNGLVEFVTKEGIIRAGTTKEVHIELLKYTGEIVPLEKDAEIPAEVYAVRMTDKQRMAMGLPKRQAQIAAVDSRPEESYAQPNGSNNSIYSRTKSTLASVLTSIL